MGGRGAASGAGAGTGSGRQREISGKANAPKDDGRQQKIAEKTPPKESRREEQIPVERGPDKEVKGVQYETKPYPRSPGSGEMIPLVSPSGLKKMGKDMESVGISTPLGSADDSTRKSTAKRMNSATPKARSEVLNSTTTQYLEKKNGSKPSNSEIENQLNHWGLSGKESHHYHPRD